MTEAWSKQINNKYNKMQTKFIEKRQSKNKSKRLVRVQSQSTKSEYKVQSLLIRRFYFVVVERHSLFI